MKRRRVLTALSGAALTQYVLQSAIAPVEAVAAPSGTTTVTDALIGSLQSTTDALRQVDATSAGTPSTAATTTPPFSGPAPRDALGGDPPDRLTSGPRIVSCPAGIL
ncbi:hypothetical protein ACR6C2_36215 [Streptomyces sp. INA 01156]